MVPHREVLYGGAAGGGKSVGLLMAALQYVDTPGYNALLLRRTYQDLALPGALMDLAHQWLGGTDAHWDSSQKRWTFPSGATVSFGYLDNDNDKYRYQSAMFQFIGFDELTQFNEVDYRYLFSRLRRIEGVDVPLRMRSATNPGGIGHDWVRRRFVQTKNDDTRVFIPALLSDNPYLDREAYEESLMMLDPVTRAQLLSGDWLARAKGPLFAGEWFDIVDVTPPVSSFDNIVRYWDLAATAAEIGRDDPDWTAGLLLGRSAEDNICYVLDVRRMRGTPKEVQRLLLHTAQRDPEETVVWIEREPGSAGKAYMDHLRGDIMAGIAVYEDRPTGDKVVRASPCASYAQAGYVKVKQAEWNNAFFEELETFPIGSHDDQVDALSGAFKKVSQSVTYTDSPL